MKTELPLCRFEHSSGPAWSAVSPAGDFLAIAVIKDRSRRSVSHAHHLRLLIVDASRAKVLCKIEVGEKCWRDADFNLHFSPDGSRLALGGSGAVRVFAVGGQAPPFQLQGHAGHVKSLAFNGDGNQLVSLNDDGTSLVWDLPD